jgi:hypothetical protein
MADSSNQRRAFAWWTLPAIVTECPSILTQPALVFFVLLPRDVAVMQAGQQDPFISSLAGDESNS